MFCLMSFQMSHVWGTDRFSVKWKSLLVTVPSLDIINFVASRATRGQILLPTIQISTVQNPKPRVSLILPHPKLRGRPPQPRPCQKPLKPWDGCSPPPLHRPRLLTLKRHHRQRLFGSSVQPPALIQQMGGESPMWSFVHLQVQRDPQQTLTKERPKSTVQRAL